MSIDLESRPLWKRRRFSIDVDGSWKLREGIPLEVAVHLTVKPARVDPLAKRINDLPKPLMIEWE